jgi:hypothetical protein
MEETGAIREWEEEILIRDRAGLEILIPGKVEETEAEGVVAARTSRVTWTPGR